MAKLARDNFVTTTTTVIVALLLAVFAAIWFLLDDHRTDNQRSYTDVGPLLISTENYSVKARIAVQTRKEDAAWAAQNQAALRRIVEAELSLIVPEKIHAPGGLAELQRSLKEATNRGLSTHKVEQILLTDFLLQTDV